MRYFTKELWEKFNDHNEIIRIQAEKEWKENSLAYQQQFAETQKYLPHSFIKNYLSRNGLHDYTIISMAIEKKGREYSCKLQLSNKLETVLLAMAGLKTLQIDIDSFQDCIQGKLSWGYSEFEHTPEKNVLLTVLCNMQNEMRFEFESIKFIKQ